MTATWICSSFVFLAHEIHCFRGTESAFSGSCLRTLTLTPIGAVLLNKLNDLPKFLRKEAHT